MGLDTNGERQCDSLLGGGRTSLQWGHCRLCCSDSRRQLRQKLCPASTAVSTCRCHLSARSAAVSKAMDMCPCSCHEVSSCALLSTNAGCCVVHCNKDA